MAGSSEERWRRSCRADLHGDEPGEGEIVPGDHSDVDTEEYYNRHSPLLCDDSDETISDCGDNAACSSAPASYGDDATSPPPPVAAANSNGGNAISSYPVVSANNNGGNASSSTVAAAAALACPICGKEFRSQKAVCGHMKVHQQHAFVGSQKDKGIKRAVVAVVGAWGGSGKRGCFGLGSKQQAASPNNGAGPDQSMAIVVAEPQIVLQPTPLAFAPPNPSPVPTASVTPTQSPVSTSPASPTTQSSPVPASTNVSGQSSTAQPTHNNGAMDTVAAGPDNNPPPSDSEVVVQQHAAPPAPVVQRAAPIVDHQHQPAAAGRQNPNGYSCPECDMWFQTHQGLGGHVAGHRNREHAAAAAAGMAMVPGSGDDDGAPSCRRNGKPEKAHVCKVCGAVFAVGVQLGGHMRKHYAGPPIVPNKKPRLVQPLVALPPPAHTLALLPNAEADEAASPDAPALELPLQHDLAPTVERAPEPAPPVTATTVGRVLLFGIDIGVRVQKPAAQEEGPSETQGSASMEQ